MVRGVVDADVLARTGGAVAHLDRAVGEALADDDDRGDPQQLGVLELDSR